MLYTLPPSAVQASLPRRPVCRFNMLGVTRMYPVTLGPSPRKSAVGVLARRAQSRGEWPGSRVTFRLGFAGLELWVGGGARVEVPGCRSYCACAWRRRSGSGEGRAGAARRELLLPPPLLFWGLALGLRLFSLGIRGTGGGGMDMLLPAGERVVFCSAGGSAPVPAPAAARAIAAAEGGGSVSVESENEGMDSAFVGPVAAVAFGVVCDSGSSGVEDISVVVVMVGFGFDAAAGDGGDLWTGSGLNPSVLLSVAGASTTSLLL
jgi:hypothetical protein